MKRFSSILVILSALVLNSCIPDNNVQSLEGSWSCEETSEIYMKSLKGTTVYPVYFAQHVDDEYTYFIDNFYQLGDGVEVKIKVSGNSIMLEPQTVDGIKFEGIGTIDVSYELINLSYTADDGGEEIDHVTAKYTR